MGVDAYNVGVSTQIGTKLEAFQLEWAVPRKFKGSEWIGEWVAKTSGVVMKLRINLRLSWSISVKL